MEDQHFSTQSSTQPRKHKNEINALLFQHSNGVAEAKGLSDHFSAEELSAFEVFITDLDKMESETSESQLQYVVWVELRFLSDDQKQWLRKYEPVLWITLHSTKIGCSSSKELFFKKMAMLQSYVPFGILHFEALLCVDSFDREQCLHFKYWQYNVRGERFLLSRDERDECLRSFPDESPGNIISGHTVPPRLQNTNVSDKNKGIVYAAEYTLP